MSTWCVVGALASYYVASMSRDLSLYDSGELALAAVTLGLGHPPGQPLHSLLGFLGSRLPFVNAAFGVNLASALPAALTLLPATSIAQTLTGHRADARSLACVPWLLAIVATHVELWEPASRTEVYAIATCGAVWAIACVLPLFVFARSPERALRSVFQASVALGLSASANPMIATAAALAITPALVHGVLRRRLPWTLFPRALLGGAIGLLPYLYLPLMAADPDRFVWGGLHDRESYARYLALRDYAHNQSIDQARWLEHIGLWFVWAGRQLILPWLALGLAGHARAPFRIPSARAIAIAVFAILLAFISSNVIWHLDVPDYNGYMASAYWLLLAGAGAFFARTLAAGRGLAASAIALASIATIVAPPAPWARTRADDRLARTLGEQVLLEAPPNAIVIALADHFAGTLFYLQEVEHARPDVVVLAYGLSGSSWHWQHLQRRHPELQPAPLRGPGGRVGRVQRWLAANGGRPLLIEQLAIARDLGLHACPGGLYLRTDALCDAPERVDPRPSALLTRQLDRLDDGSPSALGAIADVSCGIGDDLWRLGWPRAAQRMLLAGVPRAHWPKLEHALPERGPPWTGRAISWQRPAALGDPARNLFLAAAIVDADGQHRAAREYLEEAARFGLPEARALLAQMPR